MKKINLLLAVLFVCSIGTISAQKTKVVSQNPPKKTNNAITSNIITTPLGELKKIAFAVEGAPADALNTQNGQPRKFYLMQNPAGELESIWQDVKTKKIYLTKFNKNLSSSQNLLLTSAANTDILAATNDNEGNYYYMVVKVTTDGVANDVITLYKADKQGKMLLSKTQKSDKETLNIFRVGNYSATLRHKEGALAFMMGRTMNKSNDGLNHQGGIAVIFDPKTLLITRNFGQTSGHSFDNFLEKGQDDNFIAIDLGDNYPRGIHLHKFSKYNINSKVIYTFKTYHGTTADGYGKIYPLYEEISTPTQKYYKWSNDNGVYTELGGVIEVNDGYCVIFSGEPDANGKSMNSAKIGQNNNDPRNLGFIKIKKDFEKVAAKSWNVLPKEIVLSKGISEKGGFYTFGGSWTEQANEGAMWLTRYKSKETESIRHIKTALLPNGNILVLYVKGKNGGWQAESIEKSFMMCISPNGAIVVLEFDLGADLRLNRRDEILIIGKQVFVMQGKETDKKLELFVLNLK